MNQRTPLPIASLGIPFPCIGNTGFSGGSYYLDAARRQPVIARQADGRMGVKYTRINALGGGFNFLSPPNPTQHNEEV